MHKVKLLALTIAVIASVLLVPHYAAGQQAGTRVLRQGDSGADVREVQTRLSRWGYYNGPINGTFGPQTFAAVQSFQRRNGISPTGLVADQTWAALGFRLRQAATPQPAAPATPAAPAAGGQQPGSRTLRQGDSGADVREVQTRLSRWGYYNGPINGTFGPQTLAAVQSFQRRNGISATGLVAEQTWAALGFTVQQATAPVANRSAAVTTANTVSPNDMNLLARAVYSEARGEPFEGQVAVAAVILNRIRSPQFPNTISGVIFQPLAFTAVADGQFYLTPNQQSYEAARLALNGWDPTGGALYYFNPVTATSAWIWSRPYIKTIGRHRFLR